MADQPPTSSGSRWEPDPDDAATAETPDVRTAEARITEVQAPDLEPDVQTPAPDADRRAQLRGRAILAGAATALTLGGGLTGFVIGHSTAGGDDNGFTPANFSRQGPGDGRQFGDGQQPPPGFDRDGDGTGTGSSTSGNPT
ncbi:hypothetical protein ACVW00_001265 [Marmoricola sp. URHA0025 HA25]